ncbi:MAG: hypothetical protein MJ252_23540, partial [archaeon]|nr:hypothetical protein [archaeon]
MSVPASEIKEAFDLFDLQSKGTLNMTDGKEMINSFGVLVSDSELQDLAQGGNISYENILNFLEEKLKNPNQENLTEDFENLKSKKTGKLSEKKFRKYLMKFGLKYSEKEV